MVARNSKVDQLLEVAHQCGATDVLLTVRAKPIVRVDHELLAVQELPILDGESIQTIIEPVMMVVLGIVAFIIVAAVLLPVYSLAGKSFIQV